MMCLPEIEFCTEQCILQLLEAHPLKPGSIFVIGCSSSEVCGGTIGKNSNEETGRAVFAAAFRVLSEKHIYLACQCCEHLNRALVVEAACCTEHRLEPVSVVPWLHAGGSFATAAWNLMPEPVVVEHIRADAGLDIGGTLIGMHLKEVAVPFRLQHPRIGQAAVTAAWIRPKLIGGERARYR